MIETLQVSLSFICILLACTHSEKADVRDDKIKAEIKYEAELLECEETAVDPKKGCAHLVKKKNKIKP